MVAFAGQSMQPVGAAMRIRTKATCAEIAIEEGQLQTELFNARSNFQAAQDRLADLTREIAELERQREAIGSGLPMAIPGSGFAIAVDVISAIALSNRLAEIDGQLSSRRNQADRVQYERDRLASQIQELERNLSYFRQRRRGGGC
ncbi:MAG TPA: hypothetical protein PLJ34_00530 [Hyphomicrobiales bacterium]|nr:hypothetical protein [Hyphomicrobiales bacterium]